MIAFVYSTSHADVAELADAQVSEACDGDIVEVQVLSSAPIPKTKQNFEQEAGPRDGGSLFFLLIKALANPNWVCGD